MKFRLIVITAEKHFEGEAALISKLFDAGLETLHIRKPGCSRKKFEDFIAAIPPRYHKRLVLHSHYSLLADFSLGGIHLTEKKKRKSLPKQFDKKRHSLSAAFHSIRGISAAKREYDYVFLSPVFDSISKKGYKSKLDLTALNLFVHKRKGTIALGGITDKNIARTKKTGFDGAAVLGFIWEAKKPVTNFRKLLSKI